MANIEIRLAKIEAQIAPESPADARDPKLVELTQQILGKDYPIAHIPCGISGRKFVDMALKDIQGRGISLTLPIIGDDALEAKVGPYGNS